ncbi:AMP phosphorylase [Candidatus Woesearchaeota archaeon]|nr:AMP phosphorylase [Candidatus Woesearchaeota archaeon]
MKLEVKDMDISSGGPLVAVLNTKDAEKMDLHSGDRVKIIKNSRVETVLLNIGESRKAVGKGKIGLYEEVLKSIRLKDKDIVRMIPARKPASLDYIKKKLDGFKLTKKEIDQIVWDIVHNKLSEIELTYFVAACYSHELDIRETTLLTKAMASYGDTLDVGRYPIMDKHCIGGVAGNRTTMIIVPILAASGAIVPKTSSRSITSPAGTADTMEILADVDVPLKRMKKVLKKCSGCIVWGGALNLAPADDKIIRVERPLAIDAKSQLLASVIAKKASVTSTHVLVDIPTGKGAKLPSRKKALQLKRDFEMLAKKLGMKAKVIITDGKEPIGNGIGAALEARDVLWTLKNDERGPEDLKRKSLMMAGLMLEMAGKASKGKGLQMAKDILESGKAYVKMVEIIKMQGKKIIDPSRIRLGDVSYDVRAGKSGFVREISNKTISKIARVAGSPRSKGAGIYLYKHVGDRVRKNDKLYTIYCHDRHKLNYVKYAIEKLDGFVIR